jgi:hypothetical protein
MPYREPVHGDGTLIECNDGASDAFTAILETESITPPASSVATIERRRLSNTTRVEKVPTKRKDFGSATFNYEVTDVLQARLEGLVGRTGAEEKTWRITLPDGFRTTFTGYLEFARPGAAQASAIIMGSASIVLTSIITFSDTITNPPPASPAPPPFVPPQ